MFGEGHVDIPTTTSMTVPATLDHPKPYAPSVSSTAGYESSVGSPASGRYDVMHELRDATSSPSPLGEFLRDPVVLTTLMGTRKKPRRSASSQREHSRDRESSGRESTGKESRKKSKDSDTSSILTLVLAEEERQAHHLKAILRSTGDRLEFEMRRADQAESRARIAESHAREVALRVAAAETARHQAELDAARAREEIKRYQMQYESAERELRRVETELQKTDRTRKDAEQSAADARDVARRAQQALREHQVREEGREEGRRLEVRRRYNDGREDGFEDGRAEGFEAGHSEGFDEGRAEGYAAGRSDGHSAGRRIGFDEGRKVGLEDGYAEGFEEGRKEERKRALDAFDKFMDSEAGRQSFISVTTDTTRTQRWVEATSRVQEREPEPLPVRVPGSSSEPTLAPPPPEPQPEREPSPQPVRVPSPTPIPVWLHRRLNTTQDGPGDPSSSRTLPRLYA
ncbi:uncharacterized protein FIBRA_01893 [Fibroporia radiculosa]|uniref:Essential protein Yae1 N-terminal domain-containing protein n=1 Tax=Fibroporia radiculosa TaxID=599839 RepID=J4G186_9APHY|nr:uncharacterized protein FIBRA_01893 [Fibroporia radiculosa]CCL99868.1 predicted protein [Fibroporia radiculosa]